MLLIFLLLTSPFYLPKAYGGLDDLNKTKFGESEFRAHADYQINHATDDIDFLFVGSSGIATGLKPEAFADAYLNETGKRPSVVNISHTMQAPAYDYVLVQRLLERRKVKVLVLQAPEKKGTKPYPNLKYVWDWSNLFLQNQSGYVDGGNRFPLKSFFRLYLDQVQLAPYFFKSIVKGELPQQEYTAPPSITGALKDIGHFNSFRSSANDPLLPISPDLAMTDAWTEDAAPLLYDAPRLPEIYMDTGISAALMRPVRKFDSDAFMYVNWEHYFYRQFADLAQKNDVKIFYLARSNHDGRPAPNTGYTDIMKPDYFAPTLIIPMERVFPNMPKDEERKFFADMGHLNDAGRKRFSHYLGKLFVQLGF